MASKILVPTAPFAKLQINKSPSESSPASGFVISNEPNARVTHLEHSLRFLQEQHRLMLSGLHAEIEALRERNRDLQFQLIFNKESSNKPSPPATEDSGENSETQRLQRDTTRLSLETTRLSLELAAARGEARAAGARALQLQRALDAHAHAHAQAASRTNAAGTPSTTCDSERASLRARLSDAERLVRRLRHDNAAQRTELQCMKSSLHASMKGAAHYHAGAGAGTGAATGTGYHNSYHFPPVTVHDFWREPLREDFNSLGPRCRNNRRPLTLPELAATGHQIQHSTVYANTYAIADDSRSRGHNYEHKHKKGAPAPAPVNNENIQCNEEQHSTPGRATGAGEAPRRPRRYHRRTADHT